MVSAGEEVTEDVEDHSAEMEDSEADSTMVSEEHVEVDSVAAVVLLSVEGPIEKSKVQEFFEIRLAEGCRRTT